MSIRSHPLIFNGVDRTSSTSNQAVYHILLIRCDFHHTIMLIFNINRPIVVIIMNKNQRS